jgi:hypothetical protein
MTAPNLAMRFVLSSTGLILCKLFYRTNQERNMVKRVEPTESSLPLPPVRGRPFKPGNPGRPPGSKNKTTKMLEELLEGEAEDLTRKLIDLAKEGKLRPLLYCVDRLIPQRRGRPLEIQLPVIRHAHDIYPAIAAITNELNNGNLTLEEASNLTGLLESFGRAIMADDLAIRVEQLEAQMKQKKELDGRGGQ